MKPSWRRIWWLAPLTLAAWAAAFATDFIAAAASPAAPAAPVRVVMTNATQEAIAAAASAAGATPVWAQVLMWVSGVLVAVGVIWKFGLKPLADVVTLQTQVTPLLRSLVKSMGDTPHVFEILDDIAKQFRTDSGSSLRDVINRLEAASQVLRTNAEAVKILDEQDRTKLTRIAESVDVLAARLATVAAHIEGLMQAAADVRAAQATMPPTKGEVE